MTPVTRAGVPGAGWQHENGREIRRGPMEALNTHVRIIGTEDTIEPAYIRQKLARKLDKYGRSIERVSVRIGDDNGPRGGTDQRCRIKVVLSALAKRRHRTSACGRPGSDRYCRAGHRGGCSTDSRSTPNEAAPRPFTSCLCLSVSATTIRDTASGSSRWSRIRQRGQAAARQSCSRQPSILAGHQGRYARSCSRAPRA